MSKKDGSNLKSRNIHTFINGSHGFGGPLYVERNVNRNPQQPSGEDILEAEEENKSKSFFQKLKDKLLSKTTNKILTSNNLVQPEIEGISCHKCGSLCKEKDYFCSECGAKLKSGHYDD